MSPFFARLLGPAPAPRPAAADRARLAAARAAVNLSQRVLHGDASGDAPWVSARLALLLDTEALRATLPPDAAQHRAALLALGVAEEELDATLDAIARSAAERESLAPEQLVDEAARVHSLALRGFDALDARVDVAGPRRRRLMAFGAMVLLAVAVPVAGWRVAPRLRPDLAATAVWHASGAETSYHTTGVGATSVGTSLPAFFHTDKQEDPWVRFDLPAGSTVGYVEVTNRGECCLERAVPLLVEGDSGDGRWRELARRTTTFYRWSTSFPRQPLRALRLRARGSTWLHLSVVEIR